jgi:predicted transcriptional regulator
MAKIKISSKVEQREWEALQAIASESQQSIAGLLSEAVADYVRKRRLRPAVLAHLEDSIKENEELGRRLAE